VQPFIYIFRCIWSRCPTLEMLFLWWNIRHLFVYRFTVKSSAVFI
jgi:hypothetical protein